MGSVRKRKDGRFEWRSPARPDGKRKSIFEKNERGARTAGKRWMLSDEGRAWMAVKPLLAAPPEGRTLEDAIGAYLKDAEDRLRPATLAAYRAHLRTHVAPHRGHIELERLNAQHISGLYEDLRVGSKTGVSLRTLQATHTALRQVVAFAVERGWVKANPMAGLKRPGGSKQAKVKPATDLRYWSSDELRRVLDAAHRELTPQQALLFEVLAGTGCRISEALGLQFRDVRGERLTFTRTWSKARQVEPMKTETSRRTISISAKLAGLIEAERDRRSASIDAFLFDAGGGLPLDQDNARKRLLPKVIKAADVPARSLHEVRHSHAVLLLEGGAPIKVVQLRLGHADPAITLRTYSHVTPALEGGAVATLDAALG